MYIVIITATTRKMSRRLTPLTRSLAYNTSTKIWLMFCAENNYFFHFIILEEERGMEINVIQQTNRVSCRERSDSCECFSLEAKADIFNLTRICSRSTTGRYSQRNTWTQRPTLLCQFQLCNEPSVLWKSYVRVYVYYRLCLWWLLFLWTKFYSTFRGFSFNGTRHHAIYEWWVD